MTELVGDVIGLLDHGGIDEAVIVGHDWGAIIAPWVGLFRPDRVRGIALLSVPYTPRGERSIIDHIRATDPDGPFAYMLAFQEEGIEGVFEADPIEALRRMHWTLCGALPEGWVATDPLPSGLPPHLSDGEFENYYRAFTRSGFANPINYYRNLHQNWLASRPWTNAKLTMPVTFIAGQKDFVATTSDGALGSSVEAMTTWCTDLRGIHMIEGAGHWVQQEAPDQVNEILIDFLVGLDAPAVDA
jgi:pimeloyl-ACP methyl ester carboxylesterase